MDERATAWVLSFLDEHWQPPYTMTWCFKHHRRMPRISAPTICSSTNSRNKCFSLEHSVELPLLCQGPLAHGVYTPNLHVWCLVTADVCALGQCNAAWWRQVVAPQSLRTLVRIHGILKHNRRSAANAHLDESDDSGGECVLLPRWTLLVTLFDDPPNTIDAGRVFRNQGFVRPPTIEINVSHLNTL